MSEITKNKIISAVDKVAFFFFAALIFFLPISKAAIESIFGFIFLCFLIKAVVKRPPLREIKAFFKNSINLAVLIFYILIGISAATSGSLFAKSLGAWFFKWGEGVLLFYFAQVFLNRRKILMLGYVFVFSAALISIDGIYQRIWGVDFIRGFEISFQKIYNFYAIRATFDHYNDFATYCIVAFFIVCAALIKTRKALFKIALAVTSLLLISNTILTFSRGAWVALFAAMIVVALFSNNRKLQVSVLIFVLIFAIFSFLTPAIKDRIMHILDKGGDEGRFGLWHSAFLMFKDAPFFGKGTGLFMDYIGKYSTTAGQYAHNCYVQLLAETGFFGLGSFLCMLAIVVIKGLKKMRFQPDIIFTGLFGALLAFLLHSFFDTQLFTLKLSILFWLLLSFVTIFLKEDSSSDLGLSNT